MWFALLLLQLGCSSEPTSSSLHGEALGTTWTVRVVGDLPAGAEAALTTVLGGVDAAMSTWREDSELSEVRRGPGVVAVGEDTAEVVAAALALAEATGGAFDPTVQPLVELWGFHGRRLESLPSEDALQAARSQVGWARVSLGRGPNGPWVDAGGTALDLSAIAKGHAVDRLSATLSALGATNHMVEVGGEVRGHGAGLSGGGWRVGVDKPREGTAPGEALAAVVKLRNAALATSGNYRNRYTVDGMVVGHTLDPRTGRPVQSDVLSATVLAPSCREADGWATALMVLDPQEGLALLEARADREALILVGGSEGIVTRMTSGMAAALSHLEP
jgi:FAD:protein FMN transferase